MFGGLCYLLNGNMCCGISDDRLMVRVGPKEYESALARKHAGPMDLTRRPMKGMIFVQPEGLRRLDSIRKWVALGLGFAGSLPAK